MWSGFVKKHTKPLNELPNSYPLFRRKVKLLARLNIERCVPSVNVTHSIGTIFIWRVSVGHHDHTQRLGTHLSSPALSESNKKALVARQPLGRRCFLAAVSRTMGIVGCRKTGNVRDVLAERLLTVQMKARDRFVCIVLSGELIRCFLKVIEILLGPPVQQTSFRVELASRVVEAVA